MNPDSKGMKSFPFCSLPEELVEEILVRLPADSLVTFKRVCKWWRALISNRSFANKQLHKRTDNEKISRSPSLLFKFNYPNVAGPWERATHVTMCRDAVLLGSLCSEDGQNNDDLHCVFNGPDLMQSLIARQPLTEKRVPYVIVTHCNGIICMVKCSLEGRGDVFICNPALKEFKCISLPNLSYQDDIVGEGFGYDSRSDDYKFVRIHFFQNMYKVDLYTLGTDSWTEIKFNIELGFVMFCQTEVYCKNVYYWRSITLDDYEHILLAFDMSKEEFRRIRLPFRKGKFRWMRSDTLALWKDSVVLFHLVDFSPPFTQFEMWVMVDKVGGVEGDACWTKHLTIGPLENIKNPLKFWKEDELVIDGLDKVILSYNLYTKKIRTISIDLMVSPSICSIEPYVKSLVSINPECNSSATIAAASLVSNS